MANYYVFSQELQQLFETNDPTEINDKNHISVVVKNYTDTKLLYNSQLYLGKDPNEDILVGLKRTIDLLEPRILENELEGTEGLKSINNEINQTLIKVFKIGRNSKCICRSGKKFKNCCINHF